MLINPAAEKQGVAAYHLEWAPFELKAGVTEAQLLAVADALQTGFLGQQPGFLRRELLKGEAGQWVDAVYWHSRADFERAFGRFMEYAVCHEYFALMAAEEQADAHTGGGMRHFTLARAWA